MRSLSAIPPLRIAAGLILLAGARTAASQEGRDPYWPMRRHDARLTARAGVKGSYRSAPAVAWSFSEPALEVEVLAALRADGSAGEPLLLEPGKLPRDDPGRRGGAADPGKAAPLIPGVPGLQVVTWETIPGREADLARRAVCRREDGPEPRIAWTSEPFDTVQNTNHIIADVDADGALEVVLAPHYRVLILDGATGKTEHALRIHALRNYGFFCAVQLDEDPQLEMVVIADFVLHLDVIDMDERGPRLLWRRDLEEDIQSKRRILRPGPDPVADLDGDGRKEIAFNLYNDAGDLRWHVIALDALSGEPRLDLAGRYLLGHDDLDGDGRRELLVAEAPALNVPSSGNIAVLDWNPGREPAVRRRWSGGGARFLVQEIPLPLSHSTIVARGNEAAATMALAPGGRERGFLIAFRDGDRERIELRALSRPEPVLAATLPAGRWIAARTIESRREGESPAAALSFRARADERIEIPPARGADLRAPIARPVAAAEGRGRDAAGWIAVGPWDGGPAAFAENALGEVVALRAPAAGRPQPQVIWRERGEGPVVLADLDGDGAPEAVFADEAPDGEGRIVAAVPAGRRWARAIPGFPGPHPPWNYGGITHWGAGRFNDPGRADVWVTARRGTMHSDEFFVLRGTDGSIAWSRGEVRTPDMPPSQRGWGCGGGAVNAVDADGDGLDDVLSLYPVNYWVLSGKTGALLQSVSAASGLFPGAWGAYASPSVLDLDGDGRLEVLWSGPYHQGATDLEGKLIWHHAGGAGTATAVDAGGGRLVVVSTGWEKGGAGLRALAAGTGRLLWELPLPGNPRVEVAAGDLDGDGAEDMLLATGRTLRAVSAREDKPVELWTLELPAAPLGELAIADVDGDSRAEILLAGEDGALYCLGGPLPR